jgi:hypothetical protein
VRNHGVIESWRRRNHFDFVPAGILFLGLLFLAGIVYLIVRMATKPASQPAMVSGVPPMLDPNQPVRDREHLRMLAAFHFVLAGLMILGIGFLFLHHHFMSAFFDNPEMWKNQKSSGPPPQFFQAFVWFYIFMGFILVLAAALNFASGLFLNHRTHRMFSIVVGGLNCLHFPFGTTLGVFTIVVLARDSVRTLYGGEFLGKI